MYGSYELMESKRQKAEDYLEEIKGKAQAIGYMEAIDKLQAQLDEIMQEWKPDIEKELNKWAGVKDEDCDQGEMTDLGVIQGRVQDLEDSYMAAIMDLKEAAGLIKKR